MARTATISSSLGANGARSCPRRPSSRRTRPSARRGADGPAMVRALQPVAGRCRRRRGALERARSRRAARSTPFSTPSSQRLGLDDSKLALVGFSQGCMMALHVGLRRPRAPAAILGFSGLLVGPERLERSDGARCARRASADPARPRRPGPDDPVRRDVHGGGSARQASIPTQWHLSLGIGHGIDAEGLRQGGLFLAKAFADRRR